MSSAVPTPTLAPRSVFAARPDVGTISVFTRVFDALWAPDGSVNCAPMSSAVPTRTLTPRSVFAARPDVGTPRKSVALPTLR